MRFVDPPAAAAQTAWSSLSVVSPEAIVRLYCGTVTGPVTFSSSSIVYVVIARTPSIFVSPDSFV